MPLEGCLAGGWGRGGVFFCMCVCVCFLLPFRRARERDGGRGGGANPHEKRAKRNATLLLIESQSGLVKLRPRWEMCARPRGRWGLYLTRLAATDAGPPPCQSSVLLTHRAELGFGGAGKNHKSERHVAKRRLCRCANQVLRLQLRRGIIHFTAFLHIHEVGRYGLKPIHCSTYVQ